MKKITFITKNNNSFNTLEISKVLLHFIESDFTYFWEQCIDFASKAKASRSFNSANLQNIKNSLSACHPFVKAKINTDYNYIVTDCIIDYILSSQKITEDELFTMLLTAEDDYSMAIFRRLCQYRTNSATNEWNCLIRAKEYAKKKLDFIYATKQNSISAYASRKAYFDLTFSTLAKETGFPDKSLTSIRIYNPELMPNSPFMLSKASKSILKRLYELNDEYPITDNGKLSDNKKDELAFDVFDMMKTFPEPMEQELSDCGNYLATFNQDIYMTDSLKAIIDLEFDFIIKENIVLCKCKNCGKYYYSENSYSGKYCNRVNASAKTCREQFDAVVEKILPDEPEPENKIPQSILSRSDSISKKMSEKSDKKEFSEWSVYLENLIKNISDNEATTDDLLSFLDYSDTIIENLDYENNSIPAMSDKKMPQKYIFPTLKELEERDIKKQQSDA